MTPLVPIAMFGWIGVVVFLFARFPARRAALIGFLGGLMLLPVATFPIAGFPDYTKTNAIAVGVLLGVVAVDFRGIRALRPAWSDVPIVLFCTSPFFSAIHGGLGAHEGLSVVFNQAVTWGIPYLVGTLYFRSLAGLRDLAVGLFLGGLIYVPLCLIEIVLSPKLHLWIYGFAMTHFRPDEMRFGGWRPSVFMNAGLMVAVWMASASVLGTWLYASGALRPMARIRWAWLLTLLVLTTLALKSVNGWLLLFLGISLLAASAQWRSAVPVYATIVLELIYVLVSATGIWSREQVLPAVAAIVNQDRSRSLQFRFRNEEVIFGNAREHPWLGWGRSAAAFADRQHVIFPLDPGPRGKYAIVDSLWAAVFATFGAIGLAGLFGCLLLPVVLFLRRFPASEWKKAALAPAAGLAVVLLLYSIDNLANGFINPVFMLAAGGLTHCLSYRSA
jgi:hypothetical protein